VLFRRLSAHSVIGPGNSLLSPPGFPVPPCGNSPVASRKPFEEKGKPGVSSAPARPGRKIPCEQGIRPRRRPRYSAALTCGTFWVSDPAGVSIL
jgi:hypothetical protein